MNLNVVLRFSFLPVNAVVHCSAGIGRTGTAIFVLLCNDHLQINGRVDVISVLCHMRASRARLVENLAQFKLCLNLLDELMYGFNTVTTATDFHNRLPDFIPRSDDIFERLCSLSSGHEFSTAMRDDNLVFNRCPHILPANSQSIFLPVSLVK